MEVLFLVATWQPAAPAAYYKSQSAYYVGGVEPRGAWYAPARDFGLVDGATVDLDNFERLLCGLGDDGKTLIANQRGRAADRVPAFDVTFSAPRSASLAWAFASADPKKAIESAQERAVRAALTLLESEATFARRGRNGEQVERVALSAALFQHGESRPAEHADGKKFADPNLHTHAVVLNLSTRADNSVGAIHSVEQRNWKMAAGAAYHAALAAELQAIGFGVDRVGYNGIFELRDVDDATIGYFSARRKEIEAELEKHGAVSGEAPALAASLAKATRLAKDKSGSKNRAEIWSEAAKARAVDVENFTESLRTGAPLDLAAGERLFAERLADLPGALTQAQSVIARKDIVRAIAAALVGTGLPPTRIDAEIDRLLANQAIVAIGSDRANAPLYSTPEIMRVERETVDSAARLAADVRFSLNAVHVRLLCERSGLSGEQTAAALGATAAGALTVISGAPGSGKTTMLLPVVAAYKKAGHRVVGAASAWRVANALRDDLAIPSRAVASWLEKLKNGGAFLARGDVLIVDEAGLLAARETHALLAHAEKVGAKVLLVGDSKQLAPIGCGSGLALVEHALEALRVDTIVRQREAWARDAIIAFGEGRAVDALDAFAERGKLVEAQGSKAAIDAIIAEWRLARSTDRRNEPLLLARTNADVAAISRAVRVILREEMLIVGPEVEIATATLSGQSTSIALARGDRIRFLGRNDALGVINGTTATIVAIRDNRVGPSTSGRKIKIVADIAGRRVEFAPEDVADHKGRARLGWAYASTVYQSQGVTVDKAIVLVDSNFDRRQIYVAASRAREDTKLVVDAAAIGKRLAAVLPPDQQSRSGGFSSNERRDWLAARLAQAKTKESTLDVEAARALAEKDRQRQRTHAAKASGAGEKSVRDKSREPSLG